MTRSELPIPDYDHLPVGSLTHRIRTLDRDGIESIMAYEHAHAARPHVVQVLQHRLDQLAAGAHPVSTAIVRMEADGRVSVLTGTTEMGQGPRTAFAQIAAEVLGIEAETVVVRGTDSRFTPYDRSTGASRSTTHAAPSRR